MTGGGSHSPLAMVVDGQEWTARTLESVLVPEGFAVLKAYTGDQALHLARKSAPDVFIINSRLPDADGLKLCQRLEEEGAVDDTTPILLLTTAPLNRADRLHALHHGAWDILQLPFDPEEIVLRVRRYIRAREALRIGLAEGLIDRDTGVYNERGLLRRVSELASDAKRGARSLGCVMLGPAALEEEAHYVTVLEQTGAGSRGATDLESVRSLAERIVEQTRLSDSFGRLGQARYAILAPGTDLEGVQVLARRLLAVIDDLGHGAEHTVPRLKAGCYAAGADPDAWSMIDEADAAGILRRAAQALRAAQEGGPEDRIGRFGTA